MNDRTYCCETALEDDATLAGTAVQVDVWLLLEYAYAWKDKALQDNLLPAAVNQSFDRLTEEFAALSIKLRVQLIKQAGSELHAPRLFFADGRDGHVRLLETRLNGFEQFPNLSAAQLLQKNVTGFTQSDQEIYLVCTNGQRDICCAKFGRPLYAQLNEQLGDRAWQTTHLGGHRYAPNLLCLPSGYVYGFVDPAISGELASNHDKGLLDLSRTRGRSHYAPAVQAAEVFARREHNLAQRSDLNCQPVAETESQYVCAYSGRASGEINLTKETLPNTPTSCEPTPKRRLQFYPVS